MREKKTLMAAAVVLLAVSMVAAPAEPKFDRVPAAAMKALKGEKGKLIRSGFVFVNGHYLKPPYSVIRYGNAIYINKEQVTGPIVSWRAFLAAQGVEMPAARPVASAAPPRAAEARSVDDLFDDEPAPKPAPSASAAPEEESYPDVDFRPNSRTRMLLKKVNDFRTAIDRSLRAGDVIFFSPRYARVSVDARVAKEMMAALPDLMRDVANGDDLYNQLRPSFPFMSLQICRDLVENRVDYVQLAERRRKMKEEDDLQKMFESGGTVR